MHETHSKFNQILRCTLLATAMTSLAFTASASGVKDVREPMKNVGQQAGKTITGNVKDETGEPLIGVSVFLGGGVGTITDFDGNFRLENVQENAVLTISYIGYKEVQVSVAGKTTFNFIMQPDNQELDEVVVIGYGVQKKSNVTGAISSIKEEDMKNTVVSNAASALQGKVSGVQVVQNSGAPGSTPSIRVRGYSSNGTSDPLYIVDGLKVSESAIWSQAASRAWRS